MAIFVALIAGCGPAATPQGHSAMSSCPYVKPMHGLLPVLFRIGLLPRPPLATSIAPGDATSSIVIRPDSTRQIFCGKTMVSSINDVAFAHPTLSNGKSRELQLDILVPQPPEKRPLVLYVTGGGFSQAPKEAALNLRTYVAEAGFVVASLQYRTDRDGATYREGIADVKSAIRFLRANADKYGIDAQHVAVWGESAGGYLVAMAGLTNGSRAFEAGEHLDQSSDVQAVVDKFGPSDVSQVAADFDAKAKADYARADAVMRYVGPRRQDARQSSDLCQCDRAPVSFHARKPGPAGLAEPDASGAQRATGCRVSQYAICTRGRRSWRLGLYGK